MLLLVQTAVPAAAGGLKDKPAGVSLAPVFSKSSQALTRSNMEGAIKIYVPRYHSRPYQAPLPIERISVGEPEIADVVLVNPKELIIHGRKLGSTTLMLWYQGGYAGDSGSGQAVDAFEIRVTSQRPIFWLDVEVIHGTTTDYDKSLIQQDW